ncbi:MAG TPA: hypothetical protein VE987_14515 [Polyangiaceae bacterium]|nr:hypothetical protein [Polyangiaceae bacterium]
MLTLLTAVVAGLCVLASARRLAAAVEPTGLDPTLLLRAVEDSGGPNERARLREAIVACPRAAWEAALWDALAERDDAARVALVNEQLTELDWRARRWERAPRVCASVATSAAFLFATVAVIRGLGDAPAPDAWSALLPALNALAIGVAATAFCVAVHVRAARDVRARLVATDRLVERLQALASDRDAIVDPFPRRVHRVR